MNDDWAQGPHMIGNTLLGRNYRWTQFLVLTVWLCWAPVVPPAAGDQSLRERLAATGETSETAKDLQGSPPLSATSLPQLPAGLVQHVEQDEDRIDQVLTQGNPVDAGTAQDLIRIAEAVIRTRTQHQGDQWWDTIDARHRLTDLRTWLSFTPSQRGERVEVIELRQQVESLYREGKYKEALVLTVNMIDIDRRIWGEGHRNYAQSLTDLARLYKAQGAYMQAEPLYKQALTICVQTLGSTHPDTATGLNNLAMLYETQGTYAQAEPLLKRALAIWEQTLGPSHPNTATGLISLAVLYQSQGQYAQAEPLLKRALAINEQVLGPTHPGTALNLNNLAMLYKDQGAYTQAEPLVKRALAVWEQTLGPTHLHTALGLSNLGALYFKQGAYAQAEPLLKRALAIREQTLGPTHPDTALGLGNLGALYWAQGAYSQALPLHERALAIREQTLGPMHPLTALNLNNLAELYKDQGVYTQAEPLYQRALAIREEVLGPTHPDTALSLNALAELYLAQGAHAQAEPLLKRALAIWEQTLGPTHSHTAVSLNNLAVLYEIQGAYTQVEPLLKRVLAIREQTLGPTHPDTALSLNNLAVLYKIQEAYTQAEPLLKRALAIWEQTLGPIHPATAMGLKNLGVLQTRIQPDAQAAEWLHQSAQSRWRYLTESFPFLSTHEQQQFFTKSKLDEGEYLWHLLMQVPDVDRADAYQVTLWHKQLLVEVTRQESSAVQQVWAKAPAEWQALRREREVLKRTYASQALHELQNTRTLTPEEARPSFSSTREMATRLEDLEQRLRRENSAYAQEAKLQEIRVVQVQQQLKPDQALLEYVQFHPYDETTKRLAKTMHYGVFVVRGGQTPQGNQIPVKAIDLGDADPINKTIGKFREGMQHAEAYGDVPPSGNQLKEAEAMLAEASSELRRLVWQPVEKVLTNVARVYVAPDGQLSVFPFEALVRKTKRGTWQYLVEERELVYLNTGRDLTRLALTAKAKPEQNASARSAVLIGNPKFNARPKDVARVVAGLPTMAPLRTASTAAGVPRTLGAAASQDGLRIPRDWPQVRQLDILLTQASQQLRRTGWTVTTWRDLKAVEAAVLQLQAPKILQFATHGYLLERATPEKTGNWDNPLLRSMLMMAGVNHATPEQAVFYRVGKNLLTDAEADQRQLSAAVRQQARVDIGDGVLTAYEVSGMDLHGTELVNLTACKTGLGEVTSEGVEGLRQAFFFAGARSLTTSLWEVPVNEATHQIEDFYARWLSGTKGKTRMTRYAAFRQTQLTALDHARKTYGAGHPFFWAGFIYLGDPGDLTSGALRPN